MPDHPQFQGTDRFRIVRRIGAGGMGVVYEAEDLERNTRVALKTLNGPHNDAVFRLKREFRSLSGVSHPNLAAYFDLVIDPHVCFFTMELVEGVGFDKYARATLHPDSSDWHKVREALRQLAVGLHALHQAGKLHCDIKPSNVLVTKEERVVLVDFGLVQELKRTAAFTEGWDFFGTPDYMSPEQASVDAVLGPPSDWYGVGVLLYRVLTKGAPQ